MTFPYFYVVGVPLFNDVALKIEKRGKVKQHILICISKETGSSLTVKSLEDWFKKIEVIFWSKLVDHT